MGHTTCTAEGCDTDVYAKGLCRSHYRRSRPRTRKPDPLETVTCDSCASEYQRPQRATDRWSGNYCSYLCRDYTRHGPLSSKLPATHWARVFGKSCKWTPPHVPTTTECDWCGDPVTTACAHHRFCSDRCKRVAKVHRRRARQHGAPGEFRFSDVIRQYRRQGHTCAYCTQRVSGLPDPEHVTPLSRGGRNDMSNIVAACRPCNSDKRDLLLTEWNADRLRRGLAPVRVDLDGPAFSHLVSTD